MSFLYNNTRELKSLKLFNKTKKLELLFQEENTCGIIVSCAGLHSKERIQTQEQFLENKLEITKISNKLIKLLCKNENLESLNNLLKGSLFLIQNKTKNLLLLSDPTINIILNYKPFRLRFLLLNQHLYRPKEILLLQHKKINSTINLMQIFHYKNTKLN